MNKYNLTMKDLKFKEKNVTWKLFISYKKKNDSNKVSGNLAICFLEISILPQKSRNRTMSHLI